MHEGNNEVYINIYDKETDKVVAKPLEEMVKQLMVLSIPSNFHIEALKCQSIILRTKLVRQMKAYGGNNSEDSQEADITIESLSSLTHLDQYKEAWGEDYEAYIRKIDQAVEETKGRVLLFNNRPIDAKFHLACGGSTENSENVQGNIVQYLRKVLCSYCENSPYQLNYKDILVEEIESKLGTKLTSEEVFKDMPIYGFIHDIVRDEQNRVVKIKIGNKEFKGKEIMELLNINSTRFGWIPKTIRFFTIGKGDGLGLCQYGANGMAEEGKLAEEILKYYYTGVEIKKIQNPCINIPLKGKIIVIDPGHGGEEGDGYIGPQGLKEKDVNLSMALYLEKELQSLGAEVILTRREDITVHLEDRAQMANKIGPDFFISIHQNYFNHPSKSGTEIYYFRGDQVAKRLAREIMTALTEEIKTLDKGIRPADFFLLRQVMVSSIHVEVAYISNPKEEEKLMEEDYRKRAAQAIARGFANFYRYR